MRRALVLLASLTTLAPATAQQADAPRTDTVRAGDTLWAIDERFLKDPFRWVEVHKKNAEKIRDPHWIYPGQVIDLADLFGAAIDSTATSIDNPGIVPSNEPSIFANRRPAPGRVAVEAPMTTMAAPPLARALGEAAATPNLVGLDGLLAVGVLGEVADADVGVRATRDDRSLQAFDRVVLTLPSGGGANPGARVVSVRYGPTLRGRGRVVIPTGVLRMLAVGENGAAEAQLIVAFEMVRAGESLVPLDTVLSDASLRSALEAVSTLTVLWVEGDALTPTTGQHVILSPTSDGSVLRPGDEVTFGGRATGGEGALLATLRVVKVTPQAATARVISQGLGRLERGRTGRVSARVP